MFQKAVGLCVGINLLAMLLSENVAARPEFANRHGINRCTACHFSPTGGGLKNRDGKYYGARGFRMSKYADQDFISAELRFGYSNPKNRNKVRSGLFLMAGIVGGSVPITPEGQDSELRVVISHDLLSGNDAPWDSYLRYRAFDDTETSILPQYLTVGLFHAPFGLLTDEHRTYTRIQTLADYNINLDTGAMISGQPLESLHYDFVLVNGETTSGKLNDGNAEMWGGVANLRFMSPTSWFPLMLGASYKRNKQAGEEPAAWAGAVYGDFSFERFTGGLITANLMFEYALAEGYNDSVVTSGRLLGNQDYKDSIADKKSEGYNIRFNYRLTERWSFQAQYDYLLFNKDFSGDAFQKTSLGLKAYLQANTILMLRVEQADIGAPNEMDNPAPRADDAVWAYLQFGI